VDDHHGVEVAQVGMGGEQGQVVVRPERLEGRRPFRSRLPGAHGAGRPGGVGRGGEVDRGEDPDRFLRPGRGAVNHLRDVVLGQLLPIRGQKGDGLFPAELGRQDEPEVEPIVARGGDRPKSVLDGLPFLAGVAARIDDLEGDLPAGARGVLPQQVADVGEVVAVGPQRVESPQGLGAGVEELEAHRVREARHDLLRLAGERVDAVLRQIDLQRPPRPGEKRDGREGDQRDQEDGREDPGVLLQHDSLRLSTTRQVTATSPVMSTR